MHGLYADGSSWADVLGPLQDAGLRVTSVQNPLTTLAESVAATHRTLAMQQLTSEKTSVAAWRSTPRGRAFPPTGPATPVIPRERSERTPP